MTKPTLLQRLPLGQQADSLARLEQDFEVIQLWQADNQDAALAACKDRVVAVVTGPSTPTPAEFIDKLPCLKAICSFGVGYEHVAVAYAHKKDIQVSNTPDVLNDCVADLTWGLILTTARHISHADRYVRAGQWGHGPRLPLATKVSGKKLGILGLGRIGREIAERARGFKMDVRYHGRHAHQDAGWPYEPSLLELARWADFLVVAALGGPTTHHLVNRAIIEALGPKGVLINISRGSVIDETALVHALENGELGGAGLDVFEAEPKVPDSLKQLDNVVLLPHIGSATVETRWAMVDLVLRNAQAFAKTGRVLTPIELQT
ncbi:MAG: 2-hydroxyacid dehydrogenase [Paralcaligenes sp.]